MKSKAGRKNKYFTHVLPRFDEIKQWCQLGLLNNEIAENLGVGKSAFYDYLKTYPELSELLKKSRKKAVTLIKSALFNRALGYDYDEVTVTKSEKYGTTTKTVAKHMPADPASALILLKHWDKDENGRPKWSSDPAALELKRKEVELKEKEIERNNW